MAETKNGGSTGGALGELTPAALSLGMGRRARSGLGRQTDCPLLDGHRFATLTTDAILASKKNGARTPESLRCTGAALIDPTVALLSHPRNGQYHRRSGA